MCEKRQALGFEEVHLTVVTSVWKCSRETHTRQMNCIFLKILAFLNQLTRRSEFHLLQKRPFELSWTCIYG